MGDEPSSFTVRACELHQRMDLAEVSSAKYGVDGLIATLSYAADIGLNRAFVSESWPNGLARLIDYATVWPELADAADATAVKRRLKNWERVAAHAEQLGIELYAIYHPLSYPVTFPARFPDACAVDPPCFERYVKRTLHKRPVGKVCPSSSAVRQLLDVQFRALCGLPGVRGVSCWLNRADTDLMYCNCEKCRRGTVADGLLNFITDAAQRCRAAGAKLAMRTYLGDWRGGLETAEFSALANRLPASVEIIIKQQAGDMFHRHPDNPLAGPLHHATVLVEMDVYGEYRGVQCGIISSVRHDLKRRMQGFRDAGLHGVVARGIECRHELSLDPDLFGALSRNPDLDVESWSRAWAKQRFGAVGDGVLAVLDIAEQVCGAAMYACGVNWASWGIPDDLYRLRYILFDRNARCVPGACALLDAGEATICMVAGEQAEARTLAHRLLVRCNALRPLLDAGLFSRLQASCLWLNAYTHVTGPLLASFFRFLDWERQRSEIEREHRRPALCEAMLTAEHAIDKAVSEVSLIDAGALAQQQVPAGAPRESLTTPFDNARRILADIDREISTPPASFSGPHPWPERWSHKFRETGDAVQ